MNFLLCNPISLQKCKMSWNCSNPVLSSVAEPPLIWAARDVRGPGADSGSRSKKRLRLQAKKGSSRRLQLLTLNFSSQLCKISLLMKIIYRSYCLYKLNWLQVYILLVFLAFIKDPAEAGASINKWLRLSAPTYKKIGSGSGATSKLAAPAPRHWF